ncbi:MAG: hypothetical protein WD512_19775, partial [Candidatus Paceibacterota bacterium]
MKLLEYIVKVPGVPMVDYNSLLTSALASENSDIVTILQSGESDYANLPSRNNNKLHSGIQRTNKEYKIPVIDAIKVSPVRVTSFIKNLTSRNNI